jgi:asparagine synthase (glutamine-hydrolysing)
MAAQVRNLIRQRAGFNGPPFGFVNGYSPYSCMKRYASPHSAESALQLLNRFEVAEETHALAEICRRDSAFYDYAQSLDLCNYNLRALLHRNDCMGMACSIESRFPFLDSSLAKFAVNIPYRLKMRYSFFRPHQVLSSIQDKWVLRRLAERYLPKEIVERPKQYFRYDVFRRMRLRPELFRDSVLADVFGISNRQIEHLTATFDQGLKIRLLQLEVWWEKCLLHREDDAIRRRLLAGVEIAEPVEGDRWLDTG